MTGSSGTTALLGTGHFREWVSLETWWALADGTMILRQTNGILTTGLLVTHIEAGVGHPVAHLAGWTVMVVDTRNALAAIEGIVRIAGKRTRWTLALRLMVVGDTHGTGSTLDRIAGWSTAKGLGGLILDAGL